MKTLKEIYEDFKELFEEVDEKVFKRDFLKAVNLMERRKVIVSKTALERSIKVQEHKKEVAKKYYNLLKFKWLKEGVNG